MLESSANHGAIYWPDCCHQRATRDRSRDLLYKLSTGRVAGQDECDRLMVAISSAPGFFPSPDPIPIWRNSRESGGTSAMMRLLLRLLLPLLRTAEDASAAAAAARLFVTVVVNVASSSSAAADDAADDEDAISNVGDRRLTYADESIGSFT